MFYQWLVNILNKIVSWSWLLLSIAMAPVGFYLYIDQIIELPKSVKCVAFPCFFLSLVHDLFSWFDVCVQCIPLVWVWETVVRLCDWNAIDLVSCIKKLLLYTCTTVVTIWLMQINSTVKDIKLVPILSWNLPPCSLFWIWWVQKFYKM